MGVSSYILGLIIVNSLFHVTYEELPEAARDEIGEQMIKDIIEPYCLTIITNMLSLLYAKDC